MAIITSPTSKISLKSPSPTRILHAKPNHHFFLLLPGEIVLQVDVYSKESETTTQNNHTFVVPAQINALRFRTNQRVSGWFGTCVGTLANFKADEGYYIRALYGSAPVARCSQLGVVYARQIAESCSTDESNQDQTKLTTFVGCRLGARLFFRVECDTPRAFAISIDGGIQDIVVLSEDQFETFTELHLPQNNRADHWFVLEKDEHVKAAGLVFEYARLQAMCFRTNLRISNWYGSFSSNEITWHDCEDSVGAFVCGFEIAGNCTITCEGDTTVVCSAVTGIAAIYKVEKTQDGGKKTEAAVTHAQWRNEGLDSAKSLAAVSLLSAA